MIDSTIALLFVLNWRVFIGDHQTYTPKRHWQSYTVQTPDLSCKLTLNTAGAGGGRGRRGMKKNK